MEPLVDTNVLSELARPSPNQGVLDWASAVTVVRASVITLEEIRYGLSWRPNARVEDWFERFFKTSCVVLPVTREIATLAGGLRGELRADGRTRTQADMLIAATARAHDLVLVTRNERDFEGCGARVLNPFS
jgi:toxin FitB